MKERPIAFLDSGIGGVSILKVVKHYLPNENYIYLADAKNNPYGTKTKEELFQIVDHHVQDLLTYHPKLIVVACNTATTMVLGKIREKYKNIPFIGTEPALKVIHDHYPDSKTIVLATKGTEYSERFQELCNLYQTKNTQVVEVDELAAMIEQDSPKIEAYLKEKLAPFKGTEVVVLGCTHFAFVEKEIKNVLGDVTFVDGRIGITKRVIRTLQMGHLENDKEGSLKIIAEPNEQERIHKLLEDA